MTEVALFSLLPYPAEFAGEPFNHLRVRSHYARNLEMWTEAERLGFSAIQLGEHHFSGRSLIPSPHLLLAALAQTTSTVRLATMASQTPLHEPWRLAEETALLDHLSGGRVDVGLGGGVNPDELAAVGRDPGARAEVLRNTVDIVRRCWTERGVSDDRTAVPFGPLSIVPRPYQQPHPPLCVTTASLDTARWAGADGLDIATAALPTAEVAELLAAYRQAAETAGRAPGRTWLRRRVLVTDRDDVLAAHAGGPPTDDLVRGGPHEVAAELARQAAAVGGGLSLWADYRGVPTSVVEDTVRRIGSEVLPELRRMLAPVPSRLG